MEGTEPPTSVDHARAVLARALVAMNGGDLDDAERLAEDARSLAIGAEAGREVGEARGHIRLAEENDAQAVAMFTEAAELFARVGRPLDEARCRAAADGRTRP